MASIPRFNSSTFFRALLRRFYSTSSTSNDGFVGSSSPVNRLDVPNSFAYRHSMLRPPPSVRLSKLRFNECSFIGTVVSRLRRYAGKGGVPRAFAFLEVKSDHRLANSSCFRVCLCLQGELAKVSLQHLKPNDFIYVSGALGSYEKLNANGQLETFFKVVVKDLSYVRRLDRHQTTMTTMSSKAMGQPTSPSGPERCLANRLQLWQIFFTSPKEWWDNRSSKKDPRIPDFKHKDTKECLWLRPDDPPWVIRQLELYDSNMVGCNKGDANARLDSHKWKFDDLE